MQKSCIPSSDFFKFYREKALSKIKACNGIDLEVTDYNNLGYTNDAALIVDTGKNCKD